MLHPVYHSVLTNLQSYQQYTRAPPFSAYPCQDLFFVDFLMIVFLTCLRLYLIVVLSLISLMISDFEYLFICLLIISCWYIFFAKISTQILYPFLVIFLYWVLWAICIFWILVSHCSSHLQIFSLIQEVVFLFCLWFPLLSKYFGGIYYIPGAVLRCVNAALIKYRQESWVPLGAAVPLWPLHSALCLLYLWSCDDDLVIFIPFLGRFWLNQIPTTEPSHTNWQPWLGSWFGYWPLLGPQTPA